MKMSLPWETYLIEIYHQVSENLSHLPGSECWLLAHIKVLAGLYIHQTVNRDIKDGL